MLRYQVAAHRKIELVEADVTPGPDHIAGRTLFTLISAGTEVNGAYLNPQQWSYPIGLGYAAVFAVEETGENVRGFRKGDLAFCYGQHADRQVCSWQDAIRLPDGMQPETALFGRMTAVSMATLSRLRTHPGESVLVTGLGAVGLLAMQAYSLCGFRVFGMDPDAERAALAARLSGCPAADRIYDELAGRFALALECSGTQQGAMICCEALRSGGELSLVGVPWKPTGEVHSYGILNRIFYQFLTVYTGWEASLPFRKGTNALGTQLGNAEQAIHWLNDGRMKVDGMAKIRPWQELPLLYEAILCREEKSVSLILDWRQ